MILLEMYPEVGLGQSLLECHLILSPHSGHKIFSLSPLLSIAQWPLTNSLWKKRTGFSELRRSGQSPPTD